MEITVIIGVRPHYVKAAALNSILKNTSITLKFLDIHQHYDSQLRDIYISEEKLPIISLSSPKKHLDNPIDELFRQMADVYNWLSSEDGKKSKAIIVFGDANPAFVASIVANRMNVPIIHIEAGVRRIEKEKEHWNSLITDHLSSLRYCYTSKNVADLQREGLSEGTYLVGDLFARWTISKAQETICSTRDESYVLVSIHRPQNCTITCFNNICLCLRPLKKKIIWILHPRTKDFSRLIESNIGFQTIPSQPHSNALALIKGADFILTDSGGFVREGVLLEKKVIVCHEQGMWIDLVKCGSVIRTDNDLFSLQQAVEYTCAHDFPSGKNHFIIPDGEYVFTRTLNDFLKKVSGR